MDKTIALATVKKAAKDFVDEDATSTAAALSFYAVTAIPPLVVVLTAILSIVFSGPEAAAKLVSQVQSLFGQETAQTIASIIERRSHAPNGAAAFTGVVVLLLGASGFFVQLQKALNRVWDVEPDPEAGWMQTVVKRVLGMTVVLGTGFLLLISLVLSALISAASHWLEQRVSWNVHMTTFVEATVALITITCLFALLFKYLPDAEVHWVDVWYGAFSTALLFTVGKFVLGWYLGRTDFTADYGSSGALVLVLFWVYYSSIILLFGAELTQAVAQLRGRAVVPEEGAKRAGGRKREKRSLPG